MPERCRSLAANLQLSYTLCRLATMGTKDTNVRMSLQTLRVMEIFLENPMEQLQVRAFRR
jgi:hypothetical protein